MPIIYRIQGAILAESYERVNQKLWLSNHSKTFHYKESGWNRIDKSELCVTKSFKRTIFETFTLIFSEPLICKAPRQLVCFQALQHQCKHLEMLPSAANSDRGQTGLIHNVNKQMGQNPHLP